MAQHVAGRIDGHERLCTERWEQSRQGLARVERGVAGLYKRWWGLATGIIIMLFGLIGSVAYVAWRLGQLAQVFGK